MIHQTRPDVLDRLYNGPISDLNARLRYRDANGNLVYWKEEQGAGGFEAGSVGSWLYRATQGRAYYPRLGMDSYNPANDDSFFAMAQTLYHNAVSLGVPPEKRFLDLDLWEGFVRHYPERVSEVLTRLYAEGWQGIGISEHGAFSSTDNLPEEIAPTFASFVCQIDYATATVVWRPDAVRLSELRTDKHLKLYLLYIDFPEMMRQFLTLSPDEEAEALTTLARLQAYDPQDPAETGYMFVYPVGQTFWDTKKRVTSAKYNGASLYEFIRDALLPRYNPAGAPGLRPSALGMQPGM